MLAKEERLIRGRSSYKKEFLIRRVLFSFCSRRPYLFRKVLRAKVWDLKLFEKFAFWPFSEGFENLKGSLIKAFKWSALFLILLFLVPFALHTGETYLVIVREFFYVDFGGLPRLSEYIMWVKEEEEEKYCERLEEWKKVWKERYVQEWELKKYVFWPFLKIVKVVFLDTIMGGSLDILTYKNQKVYAADKLFNREVWFNLWFFVMNLFGLNFFWEKCADTFKNSEIKTEISRWLSTQGIEIETRTEEELLAAKLDFLLRRPERIDPQIIEALARERYIIMQNEFFNAFLVECLQEFSNYLIATCNSFL